MNEEVQGGETKLARCPFCGGEASLSTYETESLWSHDQVTYTKVECGQCEIAFNSEPGYELEAIAAWNRRTPSQQEHGSEVSDEAVIGDAQFLIERLDDFERDALQEDDSQYVIRQFDGHVSPAIERLRAALLAASSVSPATGVQVAKLEWSEPARPSEGVSYYDHCFAETPLGRYRLEWKSWKGNKARYNEFAERDYTDGSDGTVIYGPWQDEYVGCEYSLDQAKAAAQADFDRRVRSCLAPQPSSTDSEVKL